MAKRQTKRALITSVVSLLVCFSMLVGTTFAWFTDSVTSSGNIIKSGTLDVQMFFADGAKDVPADDAWTEIGEAKEAIFNYDKWEPGYAEARHLKIKNNGTLALKYQVRIVADGEVSDLAKVIDVYYVDTATKVDRASLTDANKLGTLDAVLANLNSEASTAKGSLKAGESHTMTLVLKMQETAGNEYQNKSIGSTFSIQLIATQDTVENDSFDNKYDDAAPLGDYVYDAAELIYALEQGESVKLGDNIVLDAGVVIPAGSEVRIDLNGKTITNAATSSVSLMSTTAQNNNTGAINNYGTVTISGDGTIDVSSSTVKAQAINNYGTMVIDGANVKGTEVVYSYAIRNYGDLTVKDLNMVAGFGGISTDAGAKTVIEDGDYTMTGNTGGHLFYLYGDGANVVINGGKFYDSINDPKIWTYSFYMNGEGTSVTVNGGEITGLNTGRGVTINGGAGTFTVNGGKLDGKFFANEQDGNTVINAGTFTVDPTNSATVNGTVTDNGDGTFTAGITQDDANDLFASVEKGGTVTLTAGKYTIPSSVTKKEFTIEGLGDATVFDFTTVNTVSGASITFKNLKIQGKNENVMNGYGIQGTEGHIAYEGCTFDGAVTNEYFGTVSYKDCTFTGTGYITTYAVKSASFENCVFDKADSRAVLVYSHGDNPLTVTLTDCEFKAAKAGYTGAGDWTSAIEVDTTNIKTAGTSVTVTNCTSDANYSGLVRDKSAANSTPAVITVDGARAAASAASLTSAFAAGGDVIITTSISGVTVKMPASLKGVTVKAVKGVSLKNSTIMAHDGSSISYEDLTFDGITFDNSRISLTGWRTGGASIKNLKVTNCVFKNLDDTTNSAPLHINVGENEAVNGLTFTDNVIDGATGGSKSGIYAQVTGKTVVTGNVINNVSFRPYVIQVTVNDGIEDEFIVTGNTFSGSAAGRAQGLGNDNEGTDKVTLVVSSNVFKDITSAQQICYWNFNPETTTADLSRNYYDIDITKNPSGIYYNSSASSVEDLKAFGVYPFYTELNADGTINLDSLVEAE